LPLALRFVARHLRVNRLRIGQPMRNLHQLQNSELIDMLAEYTLKFTHLFRIYKGINSSRQYKNYKKKIETIIAELDQRGLIPKNISSSPPNESLSLVSK
jgi:hypothetical protein